VGNVGWNNWEEIDRIANPTDGLVENSGWPCYEGASPQPGYDAANIPICENLYTNNTTQHSYYEYSHAGASSAAVTAIKLYRGGNFPAAYNGALFFADYALGWIKVMMPGTNGLPNPANIVSFDTANAVDLQTGPNGALFYVDIYGGQVRQIRYTASTNQPPVADARADATNGPLPLTVNFNGSFSSDPNPGDTLQYSWDLNGDGTYGDSTAISPQFTYSVAGNYTVRLRVTDSQGATSVDTLVISAGNSAPQVTIDSPTTSTTFQVGETIAFSGTAIDPDTGNPLPASAYKWNVSLVHCAVGNPQQCHNHPIQEILGVTSGTFVAPDHEYPSHLEMTLTATEPNSPNLSSSTTVAFNPRTTFVTIDTVPSGLEATIYSQTSTTPFTREVIVNATTSISAVSPGISGGNNYQFDSWSDGGAQTHLITAGSSPQTFTATYNQTATPTTATWNSWDVTPQPGRNPQAKVTSNTGLDANLEFYESTNNFGVAKAGLFDAYTAGVHAETENAVEKYWTPTGQYHYAGKSTVNRGSDVGEANAQAPLGVRDLQLHPPNNDHNTVAAFKVPQNGTYTISNLGVRHVYSGFGPSRYRIFNAQGTELLNIPTVTNRTWATSNNTYTLPNLTAGQYIYFAVDRNGDVFYDGTEISWTITNAPPVPDNTAPTVALSAPANGASVVGSVAVSATASDNIGVVGVQFQLDGNNLGAEDTTSPYSITWNTTTATPGSHTLTAIARDAAGNITTSTSRAVTVANPASYFPSLFTIITGTLTSGNLASLNSDNNNFLVVASVTSGSPRVSVTELEFSNVLTQVSRLDYSVRIKSSNSNTTTTIQAFNYVTGLWTQIHRSTTSTSESTKTASITSSASSYVNSQGKSKIRVQSSNSSNHSLSHELVTLTATP
jgi:PKD repeat protein